jgi:hypothetical protein
MELWQAVLFAVACGVSPIKPVSVISVLDPAARLLWECTLTFLLRLTRKLRCVVVLVC